MAASCIGTAFAEHMMIAEFLSVIRSEENHRIIHQLMLDQRLEDAPNLMVDVGDASVVADLLLADELRVAGTGAGIEDHAAFFEHRLVIPVAAHGRAVQPLQSMPESVTSASAPSSFLSQ